MALEIEYLQPFGVAVHGYRSGGAESQLEHVAELFARHSLLVFPRSALDAQEQLRIVARLAPVIEEFTGTGGVTRVEHRPEGEQVDFARGPLLYHFDLAFKDDWPIHVQSLYGEVIAASGGDTRFVHCADAADRLPEDLREALCTARVLNVFDPYGPTTDIYRSATAGPWAERAVHDALRPHPFSERQVVSINLQQSDRVIGLPADESGALLQQTFDHLYRAEAELVHHWQRDDLVIWDNRVVQHCRGDFDPREHRCLRRVIAGDADTVVPMFRRWTEQCL